jgi:hypothetical protein
MAAPQQSCELNGSTAAFYGNADAALRESRQNFLDGKQRRVQGDFIMLIVRQPSRLATKAAFAACRGRLFGGYSERQIAERSTTKMIDTANLHVWRAG